MPNIIDRIRENGLRRTAVEIVGGNWYRERNERISHVIDTAFQRGPALLPPRELVRQLGEIDPHLIDMLVQMEGWEVLSGSWWGNHLKFSEQDRLRVVYESRYYYNFDVQIGNAVEMWTDFGFGQSVKIKPIDTEAQIVWSAFWDSPRNKPLLKQRKIAALSNQQVQDGEQFFEFSGSGIDGDVIIRRVFTEEITEILYEDDDADVPLFYVRKTDSGKVYYPDWEAKRSYADLLDDYWQRHTEAGDIPKDAVRSDVAGEPVAVQVGGKKQERQPTVAVMQHAAMNEMNGRGWPQLRRAVAWSKALKRFLEDRATVARSVAAFVDEAIVDGGSRGIDAVKGKFESSLTSTSDWWERNPPAAAGSQLIHNKAVEYKRRPLGTGASDAEADAMLMVGQVSAGTKIPPHWMGFPGAMQNRATARESSRPCLEQMTRYQTFWSDVFKEWVEIVLWFASEYGGKQFKRTDAVITLESPLDLEMENITRLMDAIAKAMTDGALDLEIGQIALAKLVVVGLEDLGIRDLEPVEVGQDDAGHGGAPDGAAPKAPEEPQEFSLGGALDQVNRLITANSLRQALWALEAAVDKAEDEAGEVNHDGGDSAIT
jgi:hypothetical protein